MYSLLMISDSGQWERQDGCDFDTKRYLEHTQADLKLELRSLTPEVISNLKRWPALFAYELPWGDAPSSDMARVGWLTEIEPRGSYIRISYKFDDAVPPISATQLRKALWSLDISKSEVSRNHWAVKRVDLMEILLKKGILDGLPVPVAAPNLRAISQTVELALEDAEHMVRGGRASNAVDRVHTVLHGYLVDVCIDAKLVAPSELPSMTAAFSKLRKEHPSFVYTGPRESETEYALRASAQFIESFNTLRNNASVAHPYNAVVPEPEAMYLINMARSLLHYIEMKLQA